MRCIKKKRSSSIINMKNSPQTLTGSQTFENFFPISPVVLLIVRQSMAENGGEVGGKKTKRSRRKECASRNAAWSVWASRGRHFHTIFLMLGLLKLPALRCFCTWLAEPCRARPLVGTAALGDNSTFSLSTPAERQHTLKELLRDGD